MELGTYPEPIQAVLQKLLAAASPSAPVPMHWRYSLMSLAVFLFIMPPVDAASAKVCTVSACIAEPGRNSLYVIPRAVHPWPVPRASMAPVSRTVSNQSACACFGRLQPQYIPIMTARHGRKPLSLAGDLQVCTCL